MQPEKPKVFIGSSKESVELARAIQNNLDGDAWATVWDQGVIKLSQASWDGLIKGAWSSDFGIFVFSPDDLAQIRDQKVDVVRDNVILEFGLFTGRLGKERTFCVIPTNYAGDLHLPTDLMGITAARYQAWDPKAPASLQGILGAACNLIRNAMREAPPLPVVNYGQGPELTDIVEQINLVTRQSKEEILEVIKARLAGNISLGPAGLNDSIDQSISVDDEVERLVASGAYNQAEQLAKDRYDKQQNNVGVVEAYVGVLLRQDGIGKTKLAWQIL